jgi:nicotinic acid phosphoribosyltransferase
MLELEKKVITVISLSQNKIPQTGMLLHTDLYKLHHLAAVSLNLPSISLFQLRVYSVTHA